MTVCLELFYAFAKIGLFTFGGGYGMIPLIQQEVAARGWLEAETLYSYIAICESTPGPIAVNMATFIGSSQAGLAGSLCATLGVVMPSFIIILIIAAALGQFRQNRFVAAALSGIRPVVAGMIAATGLCIAVKCLFIFPGAMPDIRPDYGRFLIAALLGVGIFAWCGLLRRRFSPILLILTAAGLGITLYGA